MKRIISLVLCACICVLCVPVAFAVEEPQSIPDIFKVTDDFMRTDTDFPDWMWGVRGASLDNLFLPDDYVEHLAQEWGAPAGVDVEQFVFDGWVYVVTGDDAWVRYSYDVLPGKTVCAVPGGEYMSGKSVKLTDCILNVPIKTQGIHNCWAAIISYKTASDPTASEVCRKIYPLNGDHGGDMQDAIKALGKYGLNAELYADVLPFRGSGLQSVKYQLEHDCALFCRCISQLAGADSDVEHAVVLRGFKEVDDTVRLYIMDPATASYYNYTYMQDYGTGDVYFKLSDGIYIRWAETLYNIYKR